MPIGRTPTWSVPSAGLPRRCLTIASATRGGGAVRPNGLVFARMLALAATIAAGFSACSPALDWRDFTWPDGGFSVLLPARPTPETREISVGPLRLDMHLFSASVAGDVYAAGYAELPAGMDGAARERLLGDAQTA